MLRTVESSLRPKNAVILSHDQHFTFMKKNRYNFHFPWWVTIKMLKIINPFEGWEHAQMLDWMKQECPIIQKHLLQLNSEDLKRIQVIDGQFFLAATNEQLQEMLGTTSSLIVEGLLDAKDQALEKIGNKKINQFGSFQLVSSSSAKLMSVSQLNNWLLSKGDFVASFAPLFEKNLINGEIFSEMSDEDLLELEVTSSLARRLMLKFRNEDFKDRPLTPAEKCGLFKLFALWHSHVRPTMSGIQLLKLTDSDLPLMGISSAEESEESKEEIKTALAFNDKCIGSFSDSRIFNMPNISSSELQEVYDDLCAIWNESETIKAALISPRDIRRWLLATPPAPWTTISRPTFLSHEWIAHAEQWDQKMKHHAQDCFKLAGLAAQEKGSLNTVSWVDMKRTPNSSMGSHIADLSVRARGPSGKTTAIPMIGISTNYVDLTVDVSLNELPASIILGEDKYSPVEICVKDLLAAPTTYFPYLAKNINLLRPGEAEEAIVSAKICLLPFDNELEFSLEVYSYPTRKWSDQNVAVIVVSKRGAGIQIIKRGERCGVTHVDQEGRAKLFKALQIEQFEAAHAQDHSEGSAPISGQDQEEFMIIQIPLKKIGQPSYSAGVMSSYATSSAAYSDLSMVAAAELSASAAAAFSAELMPSYAMSTPAYSFDPSSYASSATYSDLPVVAAAEMNASAAAAAAALPLCAAATVGSALTPTPDSLTWCPAALDIGSEVEAPNLNIEGLERDYEQPIRADLFLCIFTNYHTHTQKKECSDQKEQQPENLTTQIPFEFVQTQIAIARQRLNSLNPSQEPSSLVVDPNRVNRTTFFSPPVPLAIPVAPLDAPAAEGLIAP